MQIRINKQLTYRLSTALFYVKERGMDIELKNRKLYVWLADVTNLEENMLAAILSENIDIDD